MTTTPAADEKLHSERWELLNHINNLTDKPMIALAFVWLGLLILELTQGLTPMLRVLSNIIWALFVLDFIIEFAIAPKKREYLRHNWLTALSLALPALGVLRVFRVFQAARAIRTFSMLRTITGLNRGARAMMRTLGKRRAGFVLALTTLVIFGGAAGIMALEHPAALAAAGFENADEMGAGFDTYGDAVWWTAMIITTIGSEAWPHTGEGRALALVISVYAIAVFGYLTATLASYFIDVDDEDEEETASLRAEIVALREQVEALRASIEARQSDNN